MESGNIEKPVKSMERIHVNKDGQIKFGYCPVCKLVNTYNHETLIQCHSCEGIFSWV